MVDRIALASETRDSSWSRVRELYDAGKFDDAYQALSQEGGEHDATYFYNLGTLAYRAGKLGPAVAYLEKANSLRRHDPEIRNNLEMVRRDLSKTIGQNRLDPASTWMESIADHVSIEELRGVLGLLMLILSMFWIRSYRKTRDLRKAMTHPAALIGTATLLSAAGLYAAERIGQGRPPAVILSRQVIRSGPGEKFVELVQADGGTKVRLLGPQSEENQENWYQVRYSQEGIGWIRGSSVFIVN